MLAENMGEGNGFFPHPGGVVAVAEGRQSAWLAGPFGV
jgi:hypothetical protein